MTAGLRSGQVAQAAGVNLQTLRYYERRGLLAAPERSPGGHRLYRPETVTTIRTIKVAQGLGFSLDEIAGLLGGRSRTSGLHEHARTKLADIEAKIADLTAIADTLRAALELGCDDLVSCAAIPECPLPFPRP